MVFRKICIHASRGQAKSSKQGRSALATALAILAWTVLAIAPAAAQDWSFLGPLTAQTLDVQPGDGAPMLFADHPDPGVANYSLIFHYYENRDGGNATHLNVGLYRRDPEGWRFLGLVPVYGYEPRDATFHPGQIDITTTMQGPNAPRCCPSVATRWAVDTETLQVGRSP